MKALLNLLPDDFWTGVLTVVGLSLAETVVAMFVVWLWTEGMAGRWDKK